MKKLLLLLVLVIALFSCKGLRSAEKRNEGRCPEVPPVAEVVNFSPLLQW
jgi:hypothetical protein